MSSNNFLQRFKGKTQTIGKEGVHNVLGGKQQDVLVYTNTNINAANTSKYKTSSSVNHHKAELPRPASKPLIPTEHKASPMATQKEQPPKSKKPENPFLVSNPFYLDEEQCEREEQARKKREKLQREQHERELREQQKNNQLDPKKTTQNTIKHKSVDKKKTEKEWVKMGGLGANIGGDAWLEKKKKLEKMQEFADQVKSINNEKAKIPKAPDRREEKKEPNNRQKALEYSKNVPKPVTIVREQEAIETKGVEQEAEELSELEQYELRHEQLKHLLKNQL